MGSSRGLEMDRGVTSVSDQRPISERWSIEDPALSEVGEMVEFSTVIRERPVVCRWVEGVLSGDNELIDRLSHVPRPQGWSDHPASVARVISEAIGSTVTVRLVDCQRGTCSDDRAGLVGDSGDPGGPDRGERAGLGDYWLG